MQYTLIRAGITIYERLHLCIVSSPWKIWNKSNIYCILFIPVYAFIPFFIFVELSSFYCRGFVYYYWCHLSSWNCWKPRLNRVYTNCKMLWSQGPHNGACGIRLHGLFETLSVVFVSDTDCFGVAPARRPNEIKHMNQIEVISFECVRTKSKLNRSEGFWQEKQTLCDHKNALPLMSLCLVTLGCWNFWWQLTLTE